jgi:hypothetical protein
MNNTQWPVDIVRMLENWARWVVADGGSSRSPYPAYNLEQPGPRAGSQIPILSGEAEDADAVIAGMSMRYQQPLRMNYLWTNVADRVNAKRCNCSLNTYKARLHEAHQLFASAWYARRTRHGSAVAGHGVTLTSTTAIANQAA